MPYVTMDFERCKDSVSASIVDDIVDDIVTCARGKLILLILESDSHVDRHINVIQYEISAFLCPYMHMVHNELYSRLMSDIHSTITTGSGCLLSLLVRVAFEVRLRKPV